MDQVETPLVMPERAWLKSIDFGAVDAAQVSRDPLLFSLLATASFTETTSHVYTRNLVEYYEGEAEIVRWLKEEWEPEELQHGRALRSYVQTVWPDFDWERAYAAFFAEYSRHCSMDGLQPTRALEMVARCVVETGTSTYYRAVHEYVGEPVLRQIAGNISRDEARHYSHFYNFFRGLDEREKNSRTAILRTIFRRLAMIRKDDGYIAFRHVFKVRFPETPFTNAHYIRFNDQMRSMYRSFYPFPMASRMLVRPLGLPPRLERAAAAAVARGGNAVALGMVASTAITLMLEGEPDAAMAAA
ncbi:MAG TPA: ferritin-like domain-containing protein [Sorangium sp.]|nr:ferritin-like domain-containing protein [Sorangium sp.]